MRGWSIRKRMLALLLVLVGAAAVLIAIQWSESRKADAALLDLKDRSLASVVAIKTVSDAYAITAVDTAVKVTLGRASMAEGRAAIEQLRESLDGSWLALDLAIRSDDKRHILNAARDLRGQADAALVRMSALMLGQDREGLQRLVSDEMYPAIDPMTAKLQSLVGMALDDATRAVEAERQRQSRVALFRMALGLLIIGWVLVFARQIARDVYRGVEALIAETRGLRSGNVGAASLPPPTGELGEVMDALRVMRSEVAESEAQLREALEKANEASRAKSVFVATMSHEIRTPLIGVTGMLEVLSHSRLDAEQRRVVGIIEHSADSLLQIIGDVLDFSKIEADRLSLDPEPADLSALVRNVAANFEGAASSKGLIVTVNIDGSVGPAYWLDPLRLRQVLSNLLSNALKFTSEGGISVAVRAEQADDSRDIVHLSVTDTGIGVTPEQVEKLFQPFTQAEASTTRRFGGTGLGLAICKRLVEMMDGRLSMQGTPNVGTTVTLAMTLTRAPAEAVAVRPSISASGSGVFRRREAPTVDEARAQGRLVLLADDHPTNREVLSRQLQIAGYACETAINGADALSRLKQGRYALLLTDLHMPELDGLELSRVWREHEQSTGARRLPIVAISAAVSTEDVAACLAAGMDGHLPKPVPIAELAKVLDSHLGAPLDGVAVDLPILDRSVEAPTHGVERGIADSEGLIPGLDRTVLIALTGGDEDAMKDVLRDFMASTEADLVALETALCESRFSDARRQAHRLKGAARLVGATQLAELASHAESCLDRGEAIDIAALRQAFLFIV